MYIVKSCHSRNNPFVGKTIRIGSIDEYRHTEIEEIADKGEATFSFNIDLNNAHISIALFNALQYGNGMLSTSMVEEWSGMRRSPVEGYIYFQRMKGRHIWNGNNCLVFCMSCLDAPEDASELFDSYDDYWYFEENKLQMVGELIRQQVESKLKKNILDTGNKAAVKRAKRFSCKMKVQKVTYSSRHINIRNNSHDARGSKFLTEIVQNYRYLKPERYSHEKEVRFIFECYDGQDLVEQNLKSIIVDATPLIPHLKRKKKVKQASDLQQSEA
ncbi:hypothetical protein [Pantoea anthophila]|uniref:hypothetical protein n=1 Tax=Pantoea anthophila TaxID=470931 RepID=UPI000A79C8D0|nr:hypothetical protein [Pantoea anthophila]